MSDKQFDHHDMGRNMYGVKSCPKCGNGRRWPTQPTHPKHPNCILCDDCGFVQPIRTTQGEE